MVRAAIAMAHSLGMAIIAEGVETQAAGGVPARSAGAEVAQGYLYGKPMPIEDFAAMARAAPESRPQPAYRATHSAARRVH